jgi:hypothetical protein
MCQSGRDINHRRHHQDHAKPNQEISNLSHGTASYSLGRETGGGGDLMTIAHHRPSLRDQPFDWICSTQKTPLVTNTKALLFACMQYRAVSTQNRSAFTSW